MSTPSPDRRTPRRTWRWYAAIATIVFLGVACVGTCGFASWFASVSLEAEERLRAIRYTIGLVEQFVFEKQRWPESWEELERISFPSDRPSPQNVVRWQGYDWPAESHELKSRVVIDFEADPDEIIGQDPLAFSAISPNGLCVQFRDDGLVESLQKTLHRVRGGKKDAEPRQRPPKAPAVGFD